MAKQADSITVIRDVFPSGEPRFVVMLGDEFAGVLRGVGGGYLRPGCRKPVFDLAQAARDLVWARCQLAIKEAHRWASAVDLPVVLDLPVTDDAVDPQAGISNA